ncbi:MAG: hypothetical protein OXH52_14720 [Gammaproteobacteria bacterium]|nr:hypothetical protein [Gammaproteobacteria bacterium]
MTRQAIDDACQGAMAPAKKWRCDRVPGSSTTLPMGIRANGNHAPAEGTAEPQRGQKCR